MIAQVAPTVDALCVIPGAAVGCAARAVIGTAVGGAPGLGSAVGGIAGGAAASLAAGMIDALATTFFDNWWRFQARVLTLWLNAPTPAPGAPGATRSWVAWLAQVALVVSILVAAGRTVLTRDGRNLAEAGRAALLTVLASAGALTVSVALVRAGDAIAAGLLNASLLEAFNSPPQNPAVTLAAFGGPTGMILTATIGYLLSIFQLLILLGRNALLPVVIVALPLAAAASGTQIGRAWFGRLAAWVLALALYKPVAAIIYAVTLGNARTADTAVAVVTGMVGMALAVFTMPALIKLLTPSAAGGGGGGNGLYGAGMAAGAATRAVTTRG